MARKRKRASYDIRPKTARVRKPWSVLSSSGKSYWRSKLDIRPIFMRRTNPLDRIASATTRAPITSPQFRTPFQKRVVRTQEDMGVRFTPAKTQEEHVQRQVYDAKRRKAGFEERELAKGKEEKPPYGYKLEEFLDRTDHPEGDYSYVLYHIFLTFLHKGENKTQYITVRGNMYNSADDLRERSGDEIGELIEQMMENDEEASYLYSTVVVIPASGSGPHLPGGVYEKEYEQREASAGRETHKVMIEREKSFIRQHGPVRG